MNDLHLISWNVTRRCNLSCTHCYLPAVTRNRPGTPPPDELSTQEAFELIDQLAEVNPEIMLILSGGEPLLRQDIFELSAYASEKGMMVLLGSNGVLIDRSVARLMKRSEVSGISISLDSVHPDVHDAVRSRPGSWEQAVAAIRHCTSEGLSVQINTVVTKDNFDKLPEIASFAESLGTTVYSPFFLVCTGRGEELTDISPQQYEQALSFVVESQGRANGMMIRTRCAPTVRRLLYERNPDSMLLKMGTGQCLAGRTYCRISPEGDVTPCPYLPLGAGNVREKCFSDIWNDSDLFHSLREQELKGKCNECNFRLLCGGCRARAYAEHKDHLGEDPWCDYRPHGGTMIQPPTFEQDASTTAVEEVKPVWTAEAEERLKRVPFFVRGMVRSACERYALELHYSEITPSIMEELKQKAGMGGMHGHR